MFWQPLSVVDAAGLRGWRRRHSVCNVGAHPGRRLGTGSPGLLRAGVDAIRHWVAPGALSDPDVVRYAASVSVWGRWFIWLVGVFLLAYRPGFWYPQDIEFLAIPVLLGVVNALVHHRLLTNRTATWRWMLLLCATDIALVTFGVVIGGGFRSFIFLAHYPTLAVFAVVFSSYWLSLAWTTAVAQGAGSPGHGGPGAGCPAERGGQVLVKNTRQGTGPRPQSSERGVIAIQRNRCCPRSSTAGRRSPFRPRVTSGSQKTGCPNRRCAWNF